MGFADELRRSKPTREELKAEKEKETRKRKENKEKYFQSQVDLCVERIKSSCSYANTQGKRHCFGQYTLYVAKIVFANIVFAERMRRAVSVRLKQEGFTAIVTLRKDDCGFLCFKYRVFW